MLIEELTLDLVSTEAKKSALEIANLPTLKEDDWRKPPAHGLGPPET